MSGSVNQVIFIVGPTAIGKTALILIAQLYQPTISADSRQFYRKSTMVPPNR